MLIDLANRSQQGITVTLWYDNEVKETWISLEDLNAELEMQTFEVRKSKALRAFYHPYPFAPKPYVKKHEYGLKV